MPLSTEHEQDMCCSWIYRTVSSSTREDTVVANVTTKKVNEQDTKTFPKCYVGRNDTQNQQKLIKHTSVWIAQDTTESRVPYLKLMCALI